MSPGTGPRSGADGEQPSRPPLHEDPAWDGAAEVARLVADIDAGLIPVPDEADAPPRRWFSLAGTCDPAEVDVAGFAQGGPLNARVPDAVLAAVAEMAADPAVLKALADSQVLGLAAAGRRLASHGGWIQQVAVAEFAARRTEPDLKNATGCGFTPFAAAHQDNRDKQAPGWRLEQPEPGVMTWHTPSGRTHTTYPTRYLI